MHTIKLLLTYYLNISVQAAKLSDCRIESNRNFFCPNWNALALTSAGCNASVVRARWSLESDLAAELGRRTAERQTDNVELRERRDDTGETELVTSTHLH